MENKVIFEDKTDCAVLLCLKNVEKITIYQYLFLYYSNCGHISH